MAVKIQVQVECPTVPEFLLFGRDVVVDIKEFTDEQLEQIGKDWTKNLIEAARKRREVPAGDDAKGEKND